MNVRSVINRGKRKISLVAYSGVALFFVGILLSRLRPDVCVRGICFFCHPLSQVQDGVGLCCHVFWRTVLNFQEDPILPVLRSRHRFRHLRPWFQDFIYEPQVVSSCKRLQRLGRVGDI
jgi:hypothetical protein